MASGGGAYDAPEHSTGIFRECQIPESPPRSACSGDIREPFTIPLPADRNAPETARGAFSLFRLQLPQHPLPFFMQNPPTFNTGGIPSAPSADLLYAENRKKKRGLYLHYLHIVLYYMQKLRGPFMQTARYKKRIVKKKSIYEETYLNISRNSRERISLLKLDAFGYVRIFRGGKHISHGTQTRHLCFSFAECGMDLLSGDLPFLHVAPGSVVFVKPGCDLKYRIVNDSRKDCFRCYLLIQDNPYIEQMFGLDEIGIIQSRDPERVRAVIMELLQMVRNWAGYSAQDFSVKLFEFLTHLCDSPLDTRRIFNKSSNLLKLVETCPQNYRNLADLMELFGMSRNTLGKYFRKHTGKSPMEFVIHARLLNSCWQLRQTEMSMEDIAVTNGYRSAAFYSRAFRNRFGVPPSEYRRRDRESPP